MFLRLSWLALVFSILIDLPIASAQRAGMRPGGPVQLPENTRPARPDRPNNRPWQDPSGNWIYPEAAQPAVQPAEPGCVDPSSGAAIGCDTLAARHKRERAAKNKECWDFSKPMPAHCRNN